MARKPTGQLYENRSKTTGEITSYGVRFRYRGKRRYVSLSATTRKEAEAALGHLMADVQRGLWTPPEDRAPDPEPPAIPTFGEFATEWYAGRCRDAGWRDEGRDGPLAARLPDLYWRLSHLAPFGPRRLDAITVEDVDRYRNRKVAEGTVAASSINKFIGTLSAIMEVAVRVRPRQRNPATGKRRRLKAPKPKRSYLDSAEHIAALLDGAGDSTPTRDAGRAVAAGAPRDARPRRAADRRGALAALAGRGPRERSPSRSRDEDRRGRPDGDLLPLLRDELLALAAARGAGSRARWSSRRAGPGGATRAAASSRRATSATESLRPPSNGRTHGSTRPAASRSRTG